MMNNRKEFFYNVENKQGLFFLISILTFGLFFLFCYTRYNERRYFLNRKKLLSLLKNNEITLDYQENLDSLYVDEYFFDYGDKKYVIWYYYQSDEFTLSMLEWSNPFQKWIHARNLIEFDLIGLFKGDLIEKWRCKKITKFLKRNNSVKLF